MATVRSCRVKDCVNNDRTAHRCRAEEIDVGKHPVHAGLGCLSFTRDNVYLREQLKASIQARRKEG